MGDGMSGDDVLGEGLSGDEVLEDGMTVLLTVYPVGMTLVFRVQWPSPNPHPPCGTTHSPSLSLCTAVAQLRRGEPVWSSGSPRQ